MDCIPGEVDAVRLPAERPPFRCSAGETGANYVVYQSMWIDRTFDRHVNLETFKKIPYMRQPSGQPKALFRRRLKIARHAAAS